VDSQAGDGEVTGVATPGLAEPGAKADGGGDDRVFGIHPVNQMT
jgi:hypothetical protein